VATQDKCGDTKLTQN